MSMSLPNATETLIDLFIKSVWVGINWFVLVKMGEVDWTSKRPLWLLFVTNLILMGSLLYSLFISGDGFPILVCVVSLVIWGSRNP